jgi:hypothetical protein
MRGPDSGQPDSRQLASAQRRVMQEQHIGGIDRRRTPFRILLADVRADCCVKNDEPPLIAAAYPPQPPSAIRLIAACMGLRHTKARPRPNTHSSIDCHQNSYCQIATTHSLCRNRWRQQCVKESCGLLRLARTQREGRSRHHASERRNWKPS